MIPLSHLPLDCQAVFLSCGEANRYPKLADMGLVEGSVWTVIQKMPLNGPLVLSNGTSRISIREEDANTILMEPLG